MKCPYCGFTESKVIDSRPTEEGGAIRRRRECLECTQRFTTYEKIETVPIMVVKKDKIREEFSPEKLMNGILRACQKRPIPMNVIENMVNDIETVVQNSMEHEVSSDKIGEMVMDRLREIDEVAYVRFASVYRQFKDINTFRDELNKLLSDKKI